MMDIDKILERFIIDELLPESDKNNIGPDESLISGGILDSMAMLQLIAFIEERFGVSVEDDDVNPDNFDSINTMKSFLEQKMQGN